MSRGAGCKCSFLGGKCSSFGKCCLTKTSCAYRKNFSSNLEPLNSFAVPCLTTPKVQRPTCAPGRSSQDLDLPLPTAAHWPRGARARSAMVSLWSLVCVVTVSVTLFYVNLTYTVHTVVLSIPTFSFFSHVPDPRHETADPDTPTRGRGPLASGDGRGAGAHRTGVRGPRSACGGGGLSRTRPGGLHAFALLT